MTQANHPRQPFDSNGAGVALADLDGDGASTSHSPVSVRR